ncbi:MAG: sugar phosphate isomerase/epimerase family protein [Oligosphaeraceae bacterium]
MNIAVNTDFLSGQGCPQPALRAIAEAGFTHLHWCHQWCTDFLYSPSEIRQIGCWLREYGLRLLDIHGSAGQEKVWFSTEEYVRQAGVDLVRNRLEMLHELGGTGALMMHIPCFQHGNSPERNEQVRRQVDALRRSLDELMPTLERLDTRIAIENMWSDTFEVIHQLLQDYPAHRLGICYDSGHANGRILPGIDAGERDKHRLMALHLHDNDGLADQHQPPFMGTLDWNRLAAIIASSGYPREISFEIAMRCTPFYNPELKANQRPQDIADFLRDAYDRCRRFTVMVRGEQ